MATAEGASPEEAAMMATSPKDSEFFERDGTNSNEDEMEAEAPQGTFLPTVKVLPVSVDMYNPRDPTTVSTVFLPMPIPPGCLLYKSDKAQPVEKPMEEVFEVPSVVSRTVDQDEEEFGARATSRRSVRYMDSMDAICKEDDDSESGKDRTNWRAMALRKHHHLLDLYERIHPLSRSVAFGRLFNAGKAEVQETLSDSVIIQLILQHLQVFGLNRSAHILESETGVTFSRMDMRDSRLITLLRRALMDTEKIYDLTISHGEKHVDANDVEMELTDHLDALGLTPEADTEDVDIWDEGPDSEANISFNKSQIRGGSLNKLVERLSSESGDTTLLDCFLMTYRSFTTPQKFLQKLIQRYNVPANRAKDAAVIQLKVCNVLRNWVKKYPRDFNEKLLQTLNDFIDNTVSKNSAKFAKDFSKVLARIGDSDNKQLHGNVSVSDNGPKVPRNIFSPDLDIMDVDEEEIARQLTMMEFQMYASIQPSELLNQSWNKPKTRHRSPNVLALINRFNDLSLWVSAMCVEPKKIKARARNMGKLMVIAKHLRAMNNFNSLMALISGLNNAASHRLKFTKEEIPRRILEEFETNTTKTMKSDGAFKAYRMALQSADPPILPYLGTFLTDLTFIEDGNPDKITPYELINFGKRVLVYNVIENIQRYQTKGYNFQPVQQIQQRLIFPPMSDAKERDKRQKHLYSLSLQREPRGADRSVII